MNQDFIKSKQNYLKDNLVVGFSPTNFFWVSVSGDYSTDEICNDEKILNADCIKMENCYKAQICQNKDNAKWLEQKQTAHSGADERYNNTKSLYNIELTKTYNLGIGAIGLLLCIYYNSK
jgi:hypothetical protein